MKFQIRIKSEEKLAETQQAYETLVIVINRALGGKPSGSETKEEPANLPRTVEELERVLQATLG